jgi:hypothetical protein
MRQLVVGTALDLLTGLAEMDQVRWDSASSGRREEASGPVPATKSACLNQSQEGGLSGFCWALLVVDSLGGGLLIQDEPKTATRRWPNWEVSCASI